MIYCTRIRFILLHKVVLRILSLISFQLFSWSKGWRRSSITSSVICFLPRTSRSLLLWTSTPVATTSTSNAVTTGKVCLKINSENDTGKSSTFVLSMKASFPMCLIEPGTLTVARLVQPEKAASPTDLREFGNLIDARLVNHRKQPLRRIWENLVI